jgi:hypothetical protein
MRQSSMTVLGDSQHFRAGARVAGVGQQFGRWPLSIVKIEQGVAKALSRQQVKD